MLVTKDMTIMDVLKVNRGTAEVFMRSGMHCLGCPSASGESIEDACYAHGIDSDKLINELNEFLSTSEA
ncbi:MAG: DUF1858 domain-containing protein [Bacillota bacterium]